MTVILTYTAGYPQIYDIHAAWQSLAVRELLIKAVTGTLDAVTSSEPGEHSDCYMVDGKKACNVGDVIRVRRKASCYKT